MHTIVKIAILFCFPCVILIAHPSPQATQPNTNLDLVAYASTFRVHKGMPLDIVVEAKNSGPTPVRLSNTIHLSRALTPLLGRSDPPDKEIRSEDRDDAVHLTIICEVEHKYPKREFTDIHTRIVGVVTIDPMKSNYFKITIPPEMFDVGDCILTAVVRETGMASPPLQIQCGPLENEK